jgi:hypothetical protein
MKSKLHPIFIALALLGGVYQTAAQGTTAFTYQGQLHDNGTNANGTYTMIFKLYDSATSTNQADQIGSPISTSTTLANGLFSVNLDFGAGAFNGSARWLDITVTNGGTTQELSPRVQLLPAPYAQFAAVAASVTNGAITASAIANGAVGSSQLASNLTVSGSLVVSNSLQIGGTNGFINVQTVAGPPGTGLSLPNSLVFSANGFPFQYFVIAPGKGPIVYDPVELDAMGMSCEGTFVVDDSNFHSVVSIDPDGTVACSNLWVKGGISANSYGDISCLSITSSGAVSAFEFITTSDRNLKEKFTPVNNQEILERVASLPISQWNFKTDAQTRHIGPMAQDFYTAFNVGTDDKHIATVDEDGVALAAIQGLNEKLKAKDARIEALEKRLADLEQLVKTSMQK